MTVIARARDDLLVLLASMSRQRRRDVTVVADALSHTFTTPRTWDRCRWLKHLEHAGYYGHYVRNTDVPRHHLNFPLHYSCIIRRDNLEKEITAVFVN